MTADATSSRSVTVAKQRFELRRDQVERTMRYVLPDAIVSHYVVIDNRRYPPKQVIGVLTGLDRADFTSHQARRILMGLGFAVGRVPRPVETEAPTGRSSTATRFGESPLAPGAADRAARPDAAQLEPFVGQWVATRGAEVLIAAPDPHTVVSWLASRRLRADSMFRVPASEAEASGAAPL
jgi:hypothetical protein